MRIEKPIRAPGYHKSKLSILWRFRASVWREKRFRRLLFHRSTADLRRLMEDKCE